MSVAQFITMTLITFADIIRKEVVVAASVIVPTLFGAFCVICLITYIKYLQTHMGE